MARTCSSVNSSRRPCTTSSIRCVDSSTRGTSPWLRTYSSADGVRGQARSSSVLSAGSAFSGWRPAVKAHRKPSKNMPLRPPPHDAPPHTPVRRMSSSRRATQSSGVPLSAAQTHGGATSCTTRVPLRLLACAQQRTRCARNVCHTREPHTSCVSGQERVPGGAVDSSHHNMMQETGSAPRAKSCKRWRAPPPAAARLRSAWLRRKAAEDVMPARPASGGLQREALSVCIARWTSGGLENRRACTKWCSPSRCKTACSWPLNMCCLKLLSQRCGVK